MTGLKGASEVNKDNVDLKFTPTGVQFRLNSLNGKNHVFEIKETAHKVSEGSSKFSLKSGRLPIY